MPSRKHRLILISLISLIIIQSYVISVASSATAVSSTDDWTMFRHDPSHSGFTTGSGPTNSAKLLWSYKTNAAVTSSPAVANGYVVVGSRDGNVYGFNASDGQPVWHFPTWEVETSPAIYNGSVYVGTDNGYVYSLNLSTGKPVWSFYAGGKTRSSPAVVGGRVYVGSGDRNVYSLNASDGSVLWSYQTKYRVYSSPAVADGVVYVATDDFFVYALNASSGNELWRRHTGSVFSSPNVCDGSVYIGSYDGYITALNASTGNKIWEYLTGNPVDSSPAVAYGYVYAGSEDNNVYCLNATTGEKVWESPTGYWVRSSPVVADGNVYVGSEDYNIYCLDAFTGAKKWSFATGNYVDSSPAIVNGTLYVGSDDYHVYAFALLNSTGEPLPSQDTNSLPWTTILFDVIAIAIGAVIILEIVRHFYSTRQTKLNSEATSVPDRKTPWFSAHTDALCILAILAISTIFFVNLGRGNLWAADEQTYSQWAFHMVKTGDYLVPWGFGWVAIWIAKPPLIMWLMSLSYQIFGVNNFATRFWSPVFGVLSLVLVFYLGKKLFNRYVGFLSAIVLGTFTTFYVFARHAMTDVPFIFFTLGSVYFLLLSEKNKNANRYVALSGLFFGLALMTKQLQALLIPLILIIYLLVTRRSVRFLFTRRLILFWGVALLVFAPWVIYMTISFGEFWQWFFIYSNFTRVSSALEGHVESYFFYFSYLAYNETQLWVVLLPFATGLCAFNALVRRSKEDTLILLWMAIVLGLFTLAQTRLEWYILPAFPAFAIAISSFLNQLSKKLRLSARLRNLFSKARVRSFGGGPLGRV